MSRFDSQENVEAAELQARIFHQCSRQESCFTQNLKSVADSKNVTAVFCKLLYGAHNRRVASHSSCTKIIAEGKTAGENHQIAIAHFFFFVPDQIDVLMQNVSEN